MSNTASTSTDAMKAIEMAMKDMQQLQKDNKRPKAVTSSSSKKKTGVLKSFFKGIILFASFLVISPILLIKTSLWLHLSESWNVWVSLFASTATLAFSTALISALFVGIFFRKNIIKRSLQFSVIGWFGVLLPLLFFAGLTGFKTQQIATELSNAHPILRSSVSVVALFDQDIIVTDIARDASEYQKMGLREVQYSKHFQQADGYVHAIDLRTIGKAEWQNFINEHLFRFMGFKTLRHIGTADHLHISMP